MDNNKIYDIILIGAGVGGETCIKEFLTKQPELIGSGKLLWLSQDFSSSALKIINNNNIPTITGTVVYLDYFKGLIIVELKSINKKLFCKKVIVAAGSLPVNTLGAPGNVKINYNANKLLTAIKGQPKKDTLLISGKITRELLELALKFTKAYTQVILVTKEFNYIITETMQEKLKKASKHLKILPGTAITGCLRGIGKIKCILDSYTELLVDDILVDAPRIPDLTQLNSPLIKINQNYDPEITSIGESILIPIVYIIKEPATNLYIKEIASNIVNKIISEENK